MVAFSFIAMDRPGTGRCDLSVIPCNALLFLSSLELEEPGLWSTSSKLSPPNAVQKWWPWQQIPASLLLSKEAELLKKRREPPSWKVRGLCSLIPSSPFSNAQHLIMLLLPLML